MHANVQVGMYVRYKDSPAGRASIREMTEEASPQK